MNRCVHVCAGLKNASNTGQHRMFLSNYTMDELRKILGPALKKLEDDLKVDKSNLSATINKRISAGDTRTSSSYLGVLGIALLTFIIGGIILLDSTSLSRHIQAIKDITKRNVIQRFEFDT